ncbi:MULTISPECIES: YidB family protein [unclassified Acinetobacter]|uniref:YidB family protein n=1 Tax=unclassified Acinetobacter TaxID=196816 RepID=UPI0015D17109|nr:MULTISPECIES: YidB family protein [unclassified Acinetobacter]
MTNLNNIVEILAKQALGGANNQNQQGGLGGILGSVLGQFGANAGTQNTQTNAQNQAGGLGGILGSVLSQLGGAAQSQQRSSGGNASTILVAVLPLVLAWIQKQGGLQGALDKLRGQGLSSQVDDWVSTGPGDNAAVNNQQVQNLFDDAEVEQVAQETQTQKQDVYSAISTVLPQIIDSLTPQAGQTNQQEANADIQQVMNLVSGFLKR